ncbi:hypothetical protein AAF712_004094 [Marasmius tenuissimus]|uniref:RanBD1 domain-containing protein n=1 Tax=Marasmius tenuissimus TaxID=585030 RepID=A0ABR3A5H6_9AGAR|nr:hypothetical protein PM082_001625 [Marasmius tenuissimus]
MKRVAEKQITKDGGSDDDDELEETRGFQKANESALAGRKIAGLPKRGLKKVNSASAEESESASKPPGLSFGGFQGFGSNTSSSFTFNSPSSTAPPVTTSIFGSSTASPTASSTAKAFSSIIGDSAVNGNSKPIQKTTPLTSQPTIPDVSSSKSVEDDGATEYYRSLRGLNVSFVSTITKAVEGDQFVDVTGYLEQYKSLRNDIKRNYDQKKSKSSSTTSISSTTTIPTSSFSTRSQTAMPTPPASFSGFDNKPLASTSSGLGGGFTPTLGSAPSSSSPFSFPSRAPSTSTTSPAPLPFAVTSSTTSSSTTTTAPTTLFKSSAATTTANLFGTSSSTPSTSTSNPFGAPAAGGFSFGASSPDKDKSASSSTPSTPPPAGKSTFSGFGTKTSPGGGSIGNPVGFGFGAGAPGSGTSPFGFGNSSIPTSSPFSLGATAGPTPLAFGPKPGAGGSFSFGKAPATPPASQETEGGDTGEGSGAGVASGSQGTTESQESQGGEDGVAMGMFGSNPHDGNGEGEENEDTVHSVKSKVYKMKKEDGKSSWADLGTGLLKLKKHKTGEQRRLLLRNSSNGKININFNLYPGLAPSQSQKTLSFVGHEGGNAQAYMIRVKTEEQARELKEVLDREIAFVKSKSTD